MASRNRSLVFLHIPKCGGTSLTRALCAAYPADRVFTDEGNLTKDLLVRHHHMFQRGAFFHGHPDHGVLPLIDGRAAMLTVLRWPEDHAVSNYLHLRRNPSLPLHDAAVGLDFTTFHREHWWYTAFQSIALSGSFTEGSFAGMDAFLGAIPRLHALLRRIDVVGCLDRIDDVPTALLPILPRRPAPIGCLHRAVDFGVSPECIAALRADYHSLSDDPDLSRPLAAERATYDLARALARGPGSRRWWARLRRPGGTPAGETMAGSRR